MKRKNAIIVALLILLCILTCCLSACDDWFKKYPDDTKANQAEIYDFRELNIYLGKGVLLPGEPADKIMLYLNSNVIDDKFLEEPKSCMGMISKAVLEVDEYDLHIVVELTQNIYTTEELFVKELSLFDMEQCHINNKTVMKKLNGTEITYAFIDQFYCYTINVDLQNEKSSEQNIQTIEEFIAAFERYPYY